MFRLDDDRSLVPHAFLQPAQILEAVAGIDVGDCHAHQFLARVAEHAGRRLVDQSDLAVGSDDVNGVHRTLEGDPVHVRHLGTG